MQAEWTLFSDRSAVAEYLRDSPTPSDDDDKPLMDPFEDGLVLSVGVDEQILLFNKATLGSKSKNIPVRVVLTDQSMYCIFGQNKVERYANNARELLFNKSTLQNIQDQFAERLFVERRAWNSVPLPHSVRVAVVDVRAGLAADALDAPQFGDG